MWGVHGHVCAPVLLHPQNRAIVPITPKASTPAQPQEGAVSSPLPVSSRLSPCVCMQPDLREKGSQKPDGKRASQWLVTVASYYICRRRRRRRELLPESEPECQCVLPWYGEIRASINTYAVTVVLRIRVRVGRSVRTKIFMYSQVSGRKVSSRGAARRDHDAGFESESKSDKSELAQTRRRVPVTVSDTLLNHIMIINRTFSSISSLLRWP